MEVTHLSITIPRWQINVIRSITYVTFLALSFRIFYHILNGTDGYLTVPVDDFYYYFTVAKNIAASLGSTFDGITSTNGYHPIWLLMITGLHLIQSDITWFFFGIAIVCLVCSIITFELSYKLLFQTLTPNAVSYAVLLFMSLSYGWMSTWAMEVTIAIPIYLFSLVKLPTFLVSENHNAKYFFLFGLLLSVLTLSRIDLIAYCGLLLCIVLVVRKRNGSLSIKQLVYVVLGCFPILLYGIFNYIYFDSLLPISGVAKQLTKNFGFNNHLISDLRMLREGYIATIIIPAAIIALAIFRKEIAKLQNTVVLYLGIGYPILYFTIYGFQSDWIIFVWYQYMLPVAIAFGIYSIYESIKQYTIKIPTTLINFILVAVTLGVMLPKIYQTCYSQTVEWSPYPGSIYDHAQKLLSFTSTHPGRYAMGDRAGLTQYIIQRPVIQLEGLMSDNEFIDNINHQKDLLRVLTSRSVDYLIISTFTPLTRTVKGYYVEIPFVEQAGNRSKKMSTYLWQEPAFYISHSNEPKEKASHSAPQVHTYVFAVKNLIARSR